MKILSEQFGLYQVEISQEDDGFFYDINFLEEDGTAFAHQSDNQPYKTGLQALKRAFTKLAELFWQDVRDTEEIAGNGTRTRDILLGNFPSTVKPSEKEVQS